MAPQVWFDCLQKKSGIALLCGSRNSLTDHLIIDSINKIPSPQKGCLILRQPPQNFQVSSRFYLLQYSELVEPLVQKTIQDCDVVIFERLMDFDEFEWALQLSEEGRLVILQVATSNIVSALHRIYSLWPQNQGEHWRWRFAENLQIMLGQTFISQNDQEKNFAHEVALVGPEIKQWLKNGQISAFEVELEKAADRSGLVSLNQSLLQLLIRRKIDVKTAFEKSLNPENLDLLMKRIGI